jgi:lysozyme family protein
MPNVPFTPALRGEYENLFDTCAIIPKRARSVETIISALQANKARYRSIAIGVPWFFVAVIHNMESSLNFTRHLHNGDPLSRRTVQVPIGRPKNGNPPFTWDESANDALSMHGLDANTDWSLAGTLYQLERYNGWGYRLYHAHVLSPYLWGFSTHYASGKYVADGTWSDTAASGQCGAAVLLRRMAEHAQITFDGLSDSQPLNIAYSMQRPADSARFARVEDLQKWLNTFPSVFVKVDGIPGNRTSDAYKKVTGSYLPGDPRV